MLNNEELDGIIRELFYLGTEGEYWDFKEYPYFYKGQTEPEKKQKQNDLLHDIICMANNLSNKTAYIIMGVSDKPVQVTGISKFDNRWTQEMYQDFLSNKSWAGDSIPSVELRTINGGEIEVLIINNSSKVPFYLTSRYMKVNDNQIYVRKGARNTAINEQADIVDIEKLFEYRLGIRPFPKERAKNYIKDLRNWVKMKGSWDNESWYYDKFPEYTIELTLDPEDDDLNSPSYALIQTNARSSWRILRIKYHQTVLMEYTAHFVDEARGFIIQPRYDFLKIYNIGEPREYSNQYYYYLSDSIELDIMFLMKDLLNHDGDAWRTHLAFIPIFENEEEKLEVESYIINNRDTMLSRIVEASKKIFFGYNSDRDKDVEEWDKKDLAATKLVKKELEDYRRKIIYGATTKNSHS